MQLAARVGNHRSLGKGKTKSFVGFSIKTSHSFGVCAPTDELKRAKEYYNLAVVSNDLSSQDNGIGSGNSASDRPRPVQTGREHKSLSSKHRSSARIISGILARRSVEISKSPRHSAGTFVFLYCREPRCLI
jgi:hypothetical protein